MIIAVQFYGTVKDKPKHMPDEWPAFTHEHKEGAPHPGKWFTLMTEEEYSDYCAAHEHLYQEYLRKLRTDEMSWFGRIKQWFGF